MAEDPKLIALRYSIPLVEELMNDKMELQRDGIRMMDNMSEMANTMKTQEEYIKNLEKEKEIRDLEIQNNEIQDELNDQLIENQKWMIKFILLELKDTIITKNKKIAAWRSIALKCAPPTSRLHKFADEKEVPESDEEHLAIINEILKKQEAKTGATQFSEYAEKTEIVLTNEDKAVLKNFLKKHEKAANGAKAEPAVEKKTTNWKNTSQNPTSWTLGTYFNPLTNTKVLKKNRAAIINDLLNNDESGCLVFTDEDKAAFYALQNEQGAVAGAEAGAVVEDQKN